MPRVCFTLQVDPNRLDEYWSRHAAMWPEMLAALLDAGWHDSSRRQREMAPFFVDLPAGRADRAKRALGEVFNHEAQLADAADQRGGRP